MLAGAPGATVSDGGLPARQGTAISPSDKPLFLVCSRFPHPPLFASCHLHRNSVRYPQTDTWMSRGAVPPAWPTRRSTTARLARRRPRTALHTCCRPDRPPTMRSGLPRVTHHGATTGCRSPWWSVRCPRAPTTSWLATAAPPGLLESAPRTSRWSPRAKGAPRPAVAVRRSRRCRTTRWCTPRAPTPPLRPRLWTPASTASPATQRRSADLPSPESHRRPSPATRGSRWSRGRSPGHTRRWIRRT